MALPGLSASLTGEKGGLRFGVVNTDSMPKWPLLKVVGRRAKDRSPLRRLEELSSFIYKYTHDATSAGELFPVRKTVGRSRPGLKR